MKIKPRNKRLLVILEGTEKGKLKGITTKGGIEIPFTSLANYEGDSTEATLGLQNRWAKVIAVGPSCEEIQEGDRVCIEAQKWTEGMELGEEWYWFSDEDEVMLVDMLYRETQGKEQLDTDDLLTKHRMKGMYE